MAAPIPWAGVTAGALAVVPEHQTKRWLGWWGVPVPDGAVAATPEVTSAAMEAMADLLVALGGRGGVVDDLGDRFEELELDPVIVGSKGTVAVGAHLALRIPDVGPTRPTRAAEAPAPAPSPMGGVAGAGRIALVSDNDRVAGEATRMGEHRGLRFSRVATLGSSAGDLTPAALVRRLGDEPTTAVLGLCLEGPCDGRALVEALAALRGRVPTVALVGSGTAAGGRPPAPRTGTLVTRGRVWEAVAARTGLTLASSLEELVDVLASHDPLVRAGAGVASLEDAARPEQPVGPRGPAGLAAEVARLVRDRFRPGAGGVRRRRRR